MKSIVFFILVISSFSIHAQEVWAKVEEDLYKKMQTQEFVNYALSSYNLAAMPKEVMREHIVEVYKSRDVSKFIVKEMRQAGIDKLEEQAMKGMARLSPEDMRVFLSFMNTWLHHASVEDCKWMMAVGATSSASEAAKIEMKYYGKFKQEELRSYFRFLRKAMFAELNNFPSARNLNQNQIKIADDAFQLILERKIKQESVRVETLKAMSDMNNSSAKDVCDSGKLIFSSVLDMKGFAGDLMTTKFILSIQ